MKNQPLRTEAASDGVFNKQRQHHKIFKKNKKNKNKICVQLVLVGRKSLQINNFYTISSIMFGPEGQVANFFTMVYEFRKPIKGFSVGGRTPE